MRHFGPSLLLLIAATGCSNAEEQRSAAQTTADAAVYAGCSPSGFSFPLTQSSTSGRLAATLLEAVPAQPTKSSNVWTVEVHDAELASAETFMPVHNHAGVPAPTVAPAGASKFRLALDFMMRGPWEVRMNLVSAEVGSDQAVFDVCVTE